MTVTVRDMTAEDWPAVERIYREGIATGNATFESAPPSWQDFDRSKVHIPRLVAVDGGAVDGAAVDGGEVVGWAAAAQVSTRCVYEGVIDHSVYVAESARGRGVGRMLLAAFVEAAERDGIWTIESGVFPENTPSLELHKSLGFRVVGTRERVGKMGFGPHAGTWRDVVLIERRSDRSGTE